MLNYVFITILVSFPETLLILLLGLNLSNIIHINNLTVFIIAFIQSIIALLTRILNIDLGIHTIIQIISLYLLIVLFLKLKYYKAIIPVLIGSLLQGIMQSISLPIISCILGVELVDLYNNPRNIVILFIPILIISSILLVIVRKRHIVFCDISS
ncbi:hypothetical protein SAMN02745883_01530 [Caminicella sporogenes DSM 14501]|uniref:Uncharacterized protein n=1 Tax=Caminicella sporogenes DSM 14501 TaxID=1121266 RepID=A0A1M6QJW0_9FIRM|nr:hypothetical protein [Caminicella sporogenes]RKD25288.1 hypothetical protein BET04_03480 [Caminicella sporogenes]WIF95285.1 hypothetical protein QNI18_01195 [Caminicella sporogenes]SHK20458.1 hypothetical protein SAMN02745883_01530 [Caminicella sporogenes DSM 14501]